MALASVCGLAAMAAWTLAGCAAVLGVKDTSFKDKAGSLEAQAYFYTSLRPFIEPAHAPLSQGKAVVLAPTYAAALRILAEEKRCAADDCEYIARGNVNECQYLTDVLRRRGLFAGVEFQENEAPAEVAPGLAVENAAVIYLDLRERTWFYLPQYGGPGDRLNLGMYLAQNHAEVRAWLAKIEEYLGRPPLPKPPEPAPPSPPPAKPPKRPVKETKAAPRELTPAPFGLMWRANLADLRRLKAKLGPALKSGDLVEYVAKVTPQRPENTDEIGLSLHKAYGLQKIVWRGAPISNDAYGFLGREMFLNVQNILEERYGQPRSMIKYLNETQFKAREQFYSCLGQPACGSWSAQWKLPEMTVILELVPVQESVGAVLLTYQGPDWEKILNERQQLEQERLNKALKR
jgi:hypothetical protein